MNLLIVDFIQEIEAVFRWSSTFSVRFASLSILYSLFSHPNLYSDCLISDDSDEKFKDLYQKYFDILHSATMDTSEIIRINANWGLVCLNICSSNIFVEKIVDVLLNQLKCVETSISSLYCLQSVCFLSSDVMTLEKVFFGLIDFLYDYLNDFSKCDLKLISAVLHCISHIVMNVNKFFESERRRLSAFSLLEKLLEIKSKFLLSEDVFSVLFECIESIYLHITNLYNNFPQKENFINLAVFSNSVSQNFGTSISLPTGEDLIPVEDSITEVYDLECLFYLF